MEENNVENTNQEAKGNFTPIMCPHCKSKNLAFITEYHKSVGGRICAIILLLLATILIIMDQGESYAIGIVMAVFATFALLYVIVVESKTNIQCICKDCGFVWLKDESHIN